jgi:transglutaminase-like putative cysteine protease
MKDDFDVNIGRSTLFWLLITNLAILTPLYDKIMPWSIGICAICFLWRVGIYFGQVAAPPKLLVTGLGLGAATTLALVVNQIGILNAFVNLLLLGYALKYIETKQIRDVKVLVLSGYFLIGFSLLEQNSILSTLHLLLVCAINTCVLISLYQGQAQRLAGLKFSLRLLAQSLPLALLLFVVFPRLPPLWLMPSMESAKTGLTDELSFGDISRLTRSADLAFRVGFDNNAQVSNQDLYWRTLVLDDYDGKTWRQNQSIKAIQQLVRQIKPSPVAVDIAGRDNRHFTYTVISEPSYQKWLHGLDVASSDDDTLVSLPDFRLYSLTDLSQTFRYRVTSYPNAIMDKQISSEVSNISLALPQGLNPKTLVLAQEFKQAYSNPSARLNAMMRHFNQQAFFYTLSPPKLGEQQIDDFLFENKAGFCAHFASAFVYLARASGLPARLVAGYQGGEYNPDAGYYSVYQYMAHAWAEVWLEGLGWQRFDPTAMIAPERILDGFDASFDGASSYLANTIFTSLRFKQIPLLNELRYKLASLDYYWSIWVLGFDEDKKQQVLSKLFGKISLRQLASIILLISSLILLVIAYFAGLLHFSSQDTVNKRYLKICRLLEQKLLKKKQIKQKHPEQTQFTQVQLKQAALPQHDQSARQIPSIIPWAPPAQFAKDILPMLQTLRPKLAPVFNQLTEHYIALKYQSLTDKQTQAHRRQFHRAYRRLRLSLLLRR